MVGLMKTDNGWVAANSGKDDSLISGFVCSYWKLETLTKSQALTWVSSSSMDKHSATTAGGAKIPSHYIEDCQYRNLPFACAAPSSSPTPWSTGCRSTRCPRCGSA